ncbi:M56 family metallopeptidase [Maribacter sp. LLG6340-A2]|uniref:M56 family metallopeptidase n=1 Tax=Maribacter sp. LLG6340-A2 TaxID=3160834 RepID=UPI00386305BA
MGIYLLKSAACMGIFLLFYKLFLEKESMHIFKRYFLLGSILISLAIPYVVFTEVVYIEPINVSSLPTEDYSLEQYHIPSKVPIDYTYWSLLSIYCLGVLFFGIQFIKNLYQIKNTINNNPKHKTNSIIKVLLSLDIVPHTFFNYIFLNKHKFEGNEIPSAVLLHEETHAKQKHSLDILIIEILQVILWFNPLIYLYKKSIKLNHEFLADKAVLNNGLEKSDYQKLLLAFSSNAAEPQLANAINYSSIKKRFTVMKKQTSKKGIAIRTLLLLPVLALMLYGFSQKNVIAQNTIKDINIEITKSGNLLMNNEPVALEKLSKEVLRTNQNFGPYIIKNYLTAHILYDEEQYKLIDQVQSILRASGISNIEHFSKRTANILGKHGFETSEYHDKTVDEAQKIRRNNVFNEIKNNAYHKPLLEIVWIEIKNEDEIWFNNQQVLLTELNEKIKSKFPLAIENNKLAAQIYATEIIDSVFTDAITKELRKLKTKSITIFSDKYIMPKNEYEETVEITPETVILKTNDIILQSNKITKYNSLAKKYNAIPIEKRSIPLSDLRVLESIYKNMTVEERKSAQPFPECLPKNKQEKPSNEITININNKGQLLVQGDLITINELKEYLSKINKHLSFDERKKVIRSIIKVDTKTPKDVIQKANDILMEYGTATINIVGRENSMKSSQQKTATREEMKEYNRLAKKYNEMDRNQMQIKMQDVQRLKTIYSKMSTKQREDAQPYPDFPEPPKTPKEPKAPKVLKEEKSNIPLPPPPPAPKSPLDFVVEMAKKGATFMYEGNNISSDKAISLLKNNKELNIESRKDSGKQIINITKDPVTIK